MKVKFTLSIGYANGRREEEIEYPDDAVPSDEEIQKDYEDWCANHMSGGWSKVED